ncbi:MAG: ABC transporter ATP-binding protein [Bacteroidetes bacterium]|nr:ABC transporter ATP-binding protein [Bacteroidota bacterium]
MTPIIEVTNLSKQYRLGTIGTGTVSHDLNRWWHQVRGKEDPYLKIGQADSRARKGDNEYVWSLKDINFTVNAGEVLGIIGKNGAGKSTLLKILSKVTAPTTGTIKMRGRVASLLEVGTGFHPELTGRENVFLNGAILGMTKSEIKSKFDEIVDFSGVEKYIDTPVKRYSSGMYVRLAFAVAAHLEPEILIVDEVLAVGDAEFQKKCLGKMKDVSVNEGRTVLFVSHNMDSIMRLCSKTILLKRGMILEYNRTNKVIDSYLKSEFGLTAFKQWAPVNNKSNIVNMLEVKAHNVLFELNENFQITESVGISMIYEVIVSGYKIHSAFNFYDRNGINIFDSHENNTSHYFDEKNIGVYETTAWIPRNLLSEGVIMVGVALVTHDPFVIHLHEKECIAINMVDNSIQSPTRGEYVGNLPGIIRPLLNWESKIITK